jgi:hypothetical protein
MRRAFLVAGLLALMTSTALAESPAHRPAAIEAAVAEIQQPANGSFHDADKVRSQFLHEHGGPANIDPALTATTLGVERNGHFKISGTVAAPAIAYELNSCASKRSEGATKEFRAGVFKLLPVLLDKYPDVRNTKFEGGCTMHDGKYDKHAISVHFDVSDLTGVLNWETLTADQLFRIFAEDAYAVSPSMQIEAAKAEIAAQAEPAERAEIARITLLNEHSGPANIDPALVAATLGVKQNAHFKISGTESMPDISYELNSCGGWHASDASDEFKSGLVKLLPVLLARYPDMRIPRILGGCMMTDGKFDDSAISAQFDRAALDKLDWKHVTPDDMFNRISSGRFQSPAFRR